MPNQGENIMKCVFGPAEVVVGTKRYPTEKIKSVYVQKTSPSCLLVIWGFGSLVMAVVLALIIWPEALDAESTMPWLVYPVPLLFAAKGAFWLYLVKSHKPQWKVYLSGFGLPDEAARFDDEASASSFAQKLEEGIQVAIEEGKAQAQAAATH